MAVQPVEICALSGMTANRWCPARRREWLPSGEKLLPCSWHHLTDEGLLTVLPPEYRQWARSTAQDREVVQANAGATVHAVHDLRADSLRISSPADGSTYLIDPTLRREFQALTLRAVTAAPGAVEWIVDRRSLGTLGPDQPTTWPLVPGRHISVRDVRPLGRIDHRRALRSPIKASEPT
jgi:hypothetical protein